MSAVDYKAMDGPQLLTSCGADASKWAEAFMQLTGGRTESIDWSVMMGWFANAIEQALLVRRDKEMIASEALFGFCGWLTSRKELLIMGSTEVAGPAAEAVQTFCDANDLEPPRYGWTRRLKHPEKP